VGASSFFLWVRHLSSSAQKSAPRARMARTPAWFE